MEENLSITNSNNELNNNNNDWSNEHEKILVEWADKAMCYRWLHSKANANFSYLNAWFTIPVIIISTLTGTANFAQSRVPYQYQDDFTMIVGFFNILAGIISTIQQFLKITQLNEAHRVSSISWDKFYRNIKIELAKHPNERIDPKHMLKICKEEFDRLMETSPNIPDKIIKKFKINFTNEEFNKIIKPEICDILISTNEYRNQWFNEENQNKVFNETLKIELMKNNKIRKIQETNNKIIKDFIESFNILNNRQPLESEIIDNLKDKIDLEIIKKYIDNNIINSVILNISDNNNNNSSK